MAAEQLRRQRLRVATGMVTIGAQEIFERRDVLAPFADDEIASVPLQVPRLATILAPRFEPGVRRARARVFDLRRREFAAIGGIADRQSVVSGKRVSVRLDIGGRAPSKKKQNEEKK